MNTERYKKALIAKQKELEGEIVSLRSEGREAHAMEVEDPVDQVIASEGQAAVFEIGSALTDTLQAVRDALQRITDGSYGTCLDCGEEIDEARLNAVPWARYCKADQEKRDAARVAESDSLAL